MSNAHFYMELTLSNNGTRLQVGSPTIINDRLLDEAWQMVSDFIIDKLDQAHLEVDDETFRAILIEICYHLAYREMSSLCNLPTWERHWKERLGTRKRGTRSEGGPYGD